MNNSKHTPGPWAVKWNEETNRATILKPSDNLKICSILPNLWDEANAKLIAAAPDLLEALKELVYITGYRYAGKPAHDKAKAAIKKATQ